MTTIFHLDLDAFFVSVERILDPSLEGKPVIVGGDPHGRGVVAACSYEARKYGLHSAMPIRQAYKLCPHGIYVHGHGAEYSRYSKMVKDILAKYPPVIEQASIDEFYMDFTGCGIIYGSFFQLATKIQREIWEKLRLPSSIGIGGNKTIAKIASDFNKPRGITYVTPGMEKEFLAEMPVEAVPGVGKVMSRELNSRGIFRVGDIARLPSDYFSSVFGKAGIDLWEKANGKGTEFLTIEREQKSISGEHTYGSDVSGLNEVTETLFNLTAKISQGLRDKGFFASTVTLKLRYSDFITVTRSKTTEFTDDDRLIYETACRLLKNAYTRRVAIRLIGVGVSNFCEAHTHPTFFEDTESKRARMIDAVNNIRRKYGFPSIHMGTV